MEEKKDKEAPVPAGNSSAINGKPPASVEVGRGTPWTAYVASPKGEEQREAKLEAGSARKGADLATSSSSSDEHLNFQLATATEMDTGDETVRTGGVKRKKCFLGKEG
jgi:hypothetical protein